MAIIIIMLITMIAMWGSLVSAYGLASVENGKYMLDLKKINEIQLRDAGVSEVLVSGYCTKLWNNAENSFRTSRIL